MRAVAPEDDTMGPFQKRVSSVIATGVGGVENYSMLSVVCLVTEATLHSCHMIHQAESSRNNYSKYICHYNPEYFRIPRIPERISSELETFLPGNSGFISIVKLSGGDMILENWSNLPSHHDCHTSSSMTRHPTSPDHPGTGSVLLQ